MAAFASFSLSELDKAISFSILSMILLSASFMFFPFLEFNDDRFVVDVVISRYFPAVVIGGDDLLTEGKTPYWGAYYGVLTKTIGFRSGHQLAITAGWYFHQGDKPVYNKGPFGGVRYTPSFCRELKFMAEYDTHGWNIGAAMRFWKHLSVNVFTREFTCVSAGLRYECTLIH